MTPKTKLTDKVEHSLTVEYVDPAVLVEHPDNPRRGDVETIKRSLLVTSQYRPLIVSRATGHVVAGNHTLRALRELEVAPVAVTYLDNLTPEAERRILAIDNRSADLGTYDEAALVALLESMGDLDGTGYTQDDLETLAYMSRGAAGFANPDTDAHYNESPEEQAARAEAVGNYQGLGARGLAEIILVLPNTQKDQLISWLQTLRGRWGAEKTNGDLVYTAVGKAIES